MEAYNAITSSTQTDASRKEFFLENKDPQIHYFLINQLYPRREFLNLQKLVQLDQHQEF